MTVAEEDEVAAFHPVEQMCRLAHLRRGQRRGIAFQARDDLANPLAHRAPVADRDAHVGERIFQIVLESRDLGSVGDAVDFVELPRLRMCGVCPVGADIEQPPAEVASYLQYGMDDEVDREAGAAEGHAERVDQEGHVVGYREHQGVFALETVATQVGVQDAHQRVPRRAALPEGEVRERGPGQMARGTRGEIFLGDAVKIGSQEALSQLVAPGPAGGGARNTLDQRDSGSRDAAEQPIICGSSGRGHAGSSSRAHGYEVPVTPLAAKARLPGAPPCWARDYTWETPPGRLRVNRERQASVRALKP